jgi:hypothetical protein
VLTDLVAGRRAATIEEAVEIMTALDRTLSDADGLKWFNRLYLQVTLAVRDAVTTTTYLDPDFLATLDVVFANLYFDAVAAGEVDPARAPSAWRPVFECRHRRGIRPLQFALAGMNAHINRDLPEGIVTSYRSTEGAPVEGSPRHHDFDKVNDLLEAVEAQIKVEFSKGLVMLVDVACGDVDDAVAMWKVRAARAAAWTNAEVLWALSPTPALRAAFFSRLDSLTGFAGRGLLLPTAPLVDGKRGVYADD